MPFYNHHAARILLHHIGRVSGCLSNCKSCKCKVHFCKIPLIRFKLSPKPACLNKWTWSMTLVQFDQQPQTSLVMQYHVHHC